MQEPDDDVAPVNTSDCLENSPSGYDSDGEPNNVTWGNLNANTLLQCLLANFTESKLTPFVATVCIWRVID